MLNYVYLNEFHDKEMKPIWSDPEVIKYTEIKAPCTEQEIKERIERQKQFDIYFISSNEAVIGIVGCIHICESKHQFGLFYQFRKSAWGHGYATEAVQWMLGYMKQKYEYVVHTYF